MYAGLLAGLDKVGKGDKMFLKVVDIGKCTKVRSSGQ